MENSFWEFKLWIGSVWIANLECLDCEAGLFVWQFNIFSYEELVWISFVLKLSVRISSIVYPPALPFLLWFIRTTSAVQEKLVKTQFYTPSIVKSNEATVQNVVSELS